MIKTPVDVLAEVINRQGFLIVGSDLEVEIGEKKERLVGQSPISGLIHTLVDNHPFVVIGIATREEARIQSRLVLELQGLSNFNNYDVSFNYYYKVVTD